MNMKIKGVVRILKKIKRDCLDLQKHGDLTKYGEGQLNLIKVILAELD